MIRHCSKCKDKKQVLVSEYFIVWAARKFPFNQLCDNLLRESPFVQFDVHNEIPSYFGFINFIDSY